MTHNQDKNVSIETEQKWQRLIYKGLKSNCYKYVQGFKGKHEYDEERNRNDEKKMETRELKNTIFKMKNSMDGHRSRLDPDEENISKLEGRVIETI